MDLDDHQHSSNMSEALSLSGSASSSLQAAQQDGPATQRKPSNTKISILNKLPPELRERNYTYVFKDALIGI